MEKAEHIISYENNYKSNIICTALLYIKDYFHLSIYRISPQSLVEF